MAFTFDESRPVVPAHDRVNFADAPVMPRASVMAASRLAAFRQGIYDVLQSMPDPDEMIRDEGTDIYDRMLKDAHLAGAWGQIKRRILAREWEIKSADPTQGFANEVAAYAKSVFARELALRYDLEHLLTAPTHKYAVAGIEYRLDGSVWVPQSIVPLEQKHFRFDREGQLLEMREGQAVKAPDMIYIYHVNNRGPQSLYGRSILVPCYWPWRFKSAGWEFWAMALDKFGVPSIVALFEAVAGNLEKTQELADSIAGKLAAVASGSSAALGGVDSVVTVGGGKAVEGFEVFMDFCNAEMSKAIMSSTLTLEEGRQGRDRGDTQIHDQVVADTAQWYGGALEVTLTRTLVRWTTWLRYGDAALEVLPEFRFDFRRQLSTEELLKFMEQGVPMSYEALFQDANIPRPSDWPEDASDIFISPRFSIPNEPVQFADGIKKKPRRFVA